MNQDPTEKHAMLGPSSAERWINCPASVRMSRLVQREEGVPSVYAAEGTAAHDLAHITAAHRLKKSTTTGEYGRAVFRWRTDHAAFAHLEDEMQGYVDEYVDFLAEQGGTLLLEQRVPTGVPSCWGTADAVSVSPSVVHVTDLKYGMGHQVDAHQNPQTRLYGVGALEAFGDVLGDVQVVRMSIFQPRVNNIVTEEVSAVELRHWRDSIIPVAEEALGPDARFGPSEDACRWCPAAGQCTAQRDWAVARDFNHLAEVMTPAELGDALEAIPAIEAWCAAVRAHAFQFVYEKGGTVPGWKVVRSNGKRYVSDPDGALDALQMIGYELNDIAKTEPKIRGIGELEKLLGKKVFAATMDPFISKTDGSPSLVNDSDSRPSASPNTEAAAHFAGLIDNAKENVNG